MIRRLIVVFLCMSFGSQALAQKTAEPAGTDAKKALPAKQKKIRFRPTRAQQDKPRVRKARKGRTEDIRKIFTEAGLAYPPGQVLMRVFKNEDVVELWARPRRSQVFVHLKDYQICMRSGVMGPKRQRGDDQVPEGFYHISAYNAWSSYLLSMLVSYPNRSDRLRKTSRDVGGSICIHGNCVTIGCVPLTDRWIEELYLICLDTAVHSGKRTLAHLFPGRLTGKGWEKLQKDFADKPALINFWKELKVGYDMFEESGKMPRMWFNKKGAYRFKAR